MRKGETVDRRVRLRAPTTLMATQTSPVAAAIAVHGELDEQTASDLRDEILRVVDRGVVAITVDLSDVPRLSAEGVKVLTLAAEMMHNRSAALVVVARAADGQSLVASGVESGARLASILRGRREQPDLRAGA